MFWAAEKKTTVPTEPDFGVVGFVLLKLFYLYLILLKQLSIFKFRWVFASVLIWMAPKFHGNCKLLCNWSEHWAYQIWHGPVLQIPGLFSTDTILFYLYCMLQHFDITLPYMKVKETTILNQVKRVRVNKLIKFFSQIWFIFLGLDIHFSQIRFIFLRFDSFFLRFNSLFYGLLI